MKKFLFVLLLSFFFIPNVKAYTEISNPLEYGMTILSPSCSDNILKVSFSKFTFNNGYWGILDETDLSSTSKQYFVNDYLIEVKPSTTYRLDSTRSLPYYIHFFDENLNKLSSTTYYPASSFTSQDNAKYLLFGRYDVPSNTFKIVSDHSFMIHEGNSNIDYVDYEECPANVPDTTLDNFYSIYVSKLKELSEFTIENKFVLSAFVIVLIFAFLASFIYLFFGRRKR